MADRPILFSAQMVRALLDGRKTQTRRVIKPQPEPWLEFHLEGGCQRADWSLKTGTQTDDGIRHRFGLWMHCAFHESRFQHLPYAPGDRLYVREEYSFDHSWTGTPPRDVTPASTVYYWADGNPSEGDWTKPKPGMHMPRWASRLTLLVTDVRVQRLHEISEEDAKAEGIERIGAEYIARGSKAWDDGPNFYTVDCGFGSLNAPTAADVYRMLWDHLNADRGYGWDANPWVVALSFTVHQVNIDEMEAADASL